ncbi:MAG: glycosyltransferase family 2 protein [Mariprofundaceae bacterium]|nr:glycosyltransferase family 2 protein [Mariprofundaceae bacterium]
MSPVFSVVIPAYNEASGLPGALERVDGVMHGMKESFEIIVVDDGSTDRTWSEIESVCERLDSVHGIRLSRNFGKENALCAGLDAAQGEAVILMDADMQHPPEVIPQLAEQWRHGYKVVDGVKRVRGKEGWLSRLAAGFFYRLLENVTPFQMEGASDFKLMDRDVLNAWKSMGERNVFFRGMSAWVGFERGRVEFDVAERESGESKWTQLGLFGLALKAIASFSTVPLRMVSMTGLLFLVFSFLLALNTLFQYASGIAVTGFTTVILLILIVSSLILLALGIIGEYIARIYEEVKQRPRYLIEKKR